MLPTINGKSFLEVTEDDLKVLVENADYRESDYIDYKRNFAFLEIAKEKKQEKIAEFRSDVCAFANSEGGYLIFGVSDENGCASDIPGIDIPNDDTDRFELDRRNNLIPINPRTPYLKFHFVKLENGKYVVIIYVKRDSFAPYTHVVDEKYYNVYTESGVELRLREMGKKLGVEKVHPHKFRRTMATRAIEKGMPIEQVQKILGHEQIDTTLRYAMVNQNNVKLSHRKHRKHRKYIS